ncbi:MAG TPA: acetyl-CoA carboxylase biotin carboxyl carrier protein [Casimicrobiaceae bacterium]|nr:acetyl-CoA carboxylase biotin carboxyl carrier protein [Casimicrobiaceae bacterium]
MSHDNLTYEDLLRIVELVKSSEQFSEFRLKVGDIEVELKRRVLGYTPPEARPAPPSMPATSQAKETPGPRARTGEEPSSGTNLPGNATVVRAPMVGTFYRAPAPGAPPFVSVGQSVEAETIVCIIEVMKLMNSIPAGANGIVSQILVEDGQSVEAHAPLIVLEPKST